MVLFKKTEDAQAQQQQQQQNVRKRKGGGRRYECETRPSAFGEAATVAATGKGSSGACRGDGGVYQPGSDVEVGVAVQRWSSRRRRRW